MKMLYTGARVARAPAVRVFDAAAAHRPKRALRASCRAPPPAAPPHTRRTCTRRADRPLHPHPEPPPFFHTYSPQAPPPPRGAARPCCERPPLAHALYLYAPRKPPPLALTGAPSAHIARPTARSPTPHAQPCAARGTCTRPCPKCAMLQCANAPVRPCSAEPRLVAGREVEGGGGQLHSKSSS